MATDATIDYKTEQAVLGAIINDPTGSKAVIESLEVTDFGDRRHQAICLLYTSDAADEL